MSRLKKVNIWKLLAIATVVCFIGTVLLCDVFRIKQTEASALGLPEPVKILSVTSSYVPPVLKGVRLNPENPFEFEFIIDSGDAGSIKEEDVKQLVEYFLAVLAVPEEDLWVNLSPFEQDRVMSEKLSLTAMGKDLLGEDYILKQFTSSLTYPESETGRKYWDNIKELYEEAFNKVWIMPDYAEIYEDNDAAFISNASLKVLSEQDYLAYQETSSEHSDKSFKTGVDEKVPLALREYVLPVIEKEVNQGKHFVKLRQMYHSLILAVWFKNKLNDSVFRYYINKNKISGIDNSDKKIKQKIYDLYAAAYRRGVYNYIKKDTDLYDKQIKRRYFSGGIGSFTDSEKWLKRKKGVSSALKNKMFTAALLTAFVTFSPVPAHAQEIIISGTAEMSLPGEDLTDIDDVLSIILEPDRDFGIFKILDKDIYHVEFIDGQLQSKALDRLAAFIESPNNKGKVIDEAQRQRMPEAAGHDYMTEHFSRFYTECDRLGIELNSMESLLKEELLRRNLLQHKGGEYKTLKNAAIISTYQNVEEDAGIKGYRREVIEHELDHGVYFTDRKYRKNISILWRSLSPQIKNIIRAVIDPTGNLYDMTNSDLIKREFAAWFRDADATLRDLKINRVKVPEEIEKLFYDLRLEVRSARGSARDMVRQNRYRPDKILFTLSAGKVKEFIQQVKNPPGPVSSWERMMREKEVFDRVRDPLNAITENEIRRILGSMNERRSKDLNPADMPALPEVPKIEKSKDEKGQMTSRKKMVQAQ